MSRSRLKRRRNGGSYNSYIQQRPIKNFDISSSPANFYKEIGAHFKQGDVPSGSVIEWRLGDGTTGISSQADNRRMWADGSLHHAAFTLKYPNSLTASGSDTLKAYSKAGSWNNTNWTTIASITNLDIRAEITISGVTYTLGANNEITRNTNIKLVRSGPLSACWRIFGEFRNGTLINDTAEGDVWGILYLTFFNDGTYEATCRIMSSRGNNASAGSKSVTFYQLKDYSVPTVLHSNSSTFTFHAGGVIACKNTDGMNPYTGTSADKVVIGFPDLMLSDPTTTGLYDAKMTWWYKFTASEKSSMVAADHSITYTPEGMGDVTIGIDSGGANPWVGPITKWAGVAWALKDYASFRQDRINAMVACACQIWFMDATTGYNYNLNNTAYTGLTQSTSKGWGSAPTITITGGTVTNSVKQMSHAGNWGWYQWLSTGKEEWLDQLHTEIIGMIGAANPGTATFARNPIINSIQFWAVPDANQIRHCAWLQRNLTNAYWATPDGHVMKQYLLDLITGSTGAYAMWAQKQTAPFIDSSSTTLGFINSMGEDNNVGPNTNAVTSPWMHDYHALGAVLMDVNRGLITTSESFVSGHVKKFTLGRGVDGCLYGAPAFNIALIDNTAEGIYGSGSVSTFPNAWSKVNIGDFNDPGTSMSSTGTNNSGQPVVNVVDATPAEVGMHVTHGTIPAGATVISKTATSFTLSANLSSNMSAGSTIQTWKWAGPITNSIGSGCPSSGLTTARGSGPYDGGHTYPAIYHAMVSCAEIVGITGASTARNRYDSEETSAAPTEASWAPAPQWRIRVPA